MRRRAHGAREVGNAPNGVPRGSGRVRPRGRRRHAGREAPRFEPGWGAEGRAGKINAKAVEGIDVDGADDDEEEVVEVERRAVTPQASMATDATSSSKATTTRREGLLELFAPG